MEHLLETDPIFFLCLFQHDADEYILSKVSSTSFSCVGNKAKGRISKRVLQENKIHQIFRKPNISYTLKCAFFGEFGVHCLLVASVLRFTL